MISLPSQGPNGPHDRRQAVTEPAPSRIVPKPVPAAQTEDPRGYQIGQLKKRFAPKETTLQNGTTSLAFRLKPSDPDFPFELESLECDVHVPTDYPEASPTLHVKNKNIPKGFSINIEKGWDRLVQEKPGATLLALTHALDKNLEAFLSEQKVETVKLVSFKDTRHLEMPAKALSSAASQTAVAPASQAAPQVAKPYIPRESFSKEQIAEAKARRAQETRQLETRMGRLPLYRRSADGIVYTLPIEPRRRAELPAGLQPVKTLHLIIPLLYPLQPLRIQLNEVDSNDAEPTEELFIQKAAEQRDMTLMSHLNYLAQNMHTLAKQAIASQKQAQAVVSETAVGQGSEVVAGKKAATTTDIEEKSHIKVIPRPPEWTLVQEDDAHESSDDYSYDSGDESDGGGAILAEESSPQPKPVGQTAERGTSISFPSIELIGIELLQVTVLAVSVKCERCKTSNEISGLHGDEEKTASCRKCATSLAVRFRPQLVHAHSTRAGFLDLSGCTVGDLLPSTFVPTCAKCSTAAPGLVSVRGEATTNVCRECHARFTFKIPDVKFLAVTPGAAAGPTSGPRRKADRLGLHAGERLPGSGACAHYRKSYRWFRFSCCARVYPCDRCHDAAEEHPNEWANRMICGWCSREQNYAVEACQFCGRSVIGRKGRGFWEGGRGTRDRALMSRKDKRKYRRAGSEAVKKE